MKLKEIHQEELEKHQNFSRDEVEYEMEQEEYEQFSHNEVSCKERYK